ncbi:hypothetical protein OH799_06880 [Nocardia sp. NBC_00881]|uniref:hypothetical protein n=1 Tax=Nocardia sp. NBC_00881 TaxID=2975995 RepID=UPI00386A865D|nr:hypothetical protein OH799_06880 [Nocardia sp. NBC_00881]
MSFRLGVRCQWAIEDLTVGRQVELHKKEGTTCRGVLEALDFHPPAPVKASLVFTMCRPIEPGDLIYLLPANEGPDSRP